MQFKTSLFAITLALIAPAFAISNDNPETNEKQCLQFRVAIENGGIRLLPVSNDFVSSEDNVIVTCRTVELVGSQLVLVDASCSGKHCTVTGARLTIKTDKASSISISYSDDSVLTFKNEDAKKRFIERHKS